jgi:LuxR family maltose regulon positive regulatory protein
LASGSFINRDSESSLYRRSFNTATFCLTPKPRHSIMLMKGVFDSQDIAAMNDDRASIAKITRPRLTGTVGRDRLFRLMDTSRERPVIWVAAPGGSGKTTLAASWLDSRKLPVLWYQVDEGDGDIATFFHYMGLAGKRAAPARRKPLPALTPEYRSGIPLFTRRFFEDLFDRLLSVRSGRSTDRDPVLVLDNFQDAPADSPFHDMIAQGLETVPHGVTVVVLSRSEPPPQLSRLRANDRISRIGWQEIKLTRDEAREIVEAQGVKDLQADALTEIHQQTDGWAAGLILMREMIKTGRPGLREEVGLGKDEIFNYYSRELLGKTDELTRDFLLRTSLLPRITVTMARSLTNLESADRILEDLNRNQFFTQKYVQDGVVYQYHPLFREFLLFQAGKHFSADELSKIKKQATEVLEDAGMIEDAAGLAIGNKEWNELARLILGHVEALLAQGRNVTLDAWIRNVPQPVLAGQPWLLYWHGMACMPINPREGRSSFERAYASFRQRDDAAGLYLSWSGIVDTYVYQWGEMNGLDHWISEFTSLQSLHPEIPTPEIKAQVTAAVFYALMQRRPEHPDLPLWEGRLRDVLLRSEDLRFRATMGSHLVLYHTWWSGEQEKAEMLVKALRPARNPGNVPPLVLIAWRVIEAANHWMSGRTEQCLQATEEGQAIADATDVHLWDFLLLGHVVYAALGRDEPAKARPVLERMAHIGTDRHLVVARHHYFSAWEALARNRPGNALDHARTGLQITIDSEMPSLGVLLRTAVIDALIDLGEYAEARQNIEAARAITMAGRLGGLHAVVLLLDARLLYLQGDQMAGDAALREHLRTNRELGVRNLCGWRSRTILPLYARALEAGIEVEYVQEIISERRLVPDGSMLEIENWPWPVKVHTLGRFALHKDGKPVAFSRKVQKKTLEFLKAVIALGSEDVREEQIIDLLWPDSEGDAGHSAFKTALARLRQLIGAEAVVYQDGRITLDPRMVWSDAAAFLRMSERVEEEWKELKDLGERDRSAKERTARAVHELERAISLYRGPFVPDDAIAWTVSLRERLRTRLLKLVTALADHYEQKGRWKTAAEVYQKGIEADKLREEFYQRLMICYQQMGQQAEAFAVYNRCRAELSYGLGLAPSSMTESIIASIRK